MVCMTNENLMLWYEITVLWYEITMLWYKMSMLWYDISMLWYDILMLDYALVYVVKDVLELTVIVADTRKRKREILTQKEILLLLF